MKVKVKEKKRKNLKEEHEAEIEIKEEEWLKKKEGCKDKVKAPEALIENKLGISVA